MDIFTGQCPQGEATKLSTLLRCLCPTHTNHNQSLHMIGRISQSGRGKERRREGKRDMVRPKSKGDTSEESEMPCSLFPSQSPHHHVRLDGGTAQLILLHCLPLFFIFHWIKHALLPQASGLQVLSNWTGFLISFVGNWGLGQSSVHYNTYQLQFHSVTHKKRPAHLWSWITGPFYQKLAESNKVGIYADIVRR